MQKALTSTRLGQNPESFATGLANFAGEASQMAHWSPQESIQALATVSEAVRDPSAAGTYLKNFITRIGAPSKKSQMEIEKFGLHFWDKEGEMKPLPALIEEIRHGMKGHTDKEIIAALKSIFEMRGLEAVLAHARVQRAPVAAHVVREDRLPDRCPQARRRHGAADHVAKHLLERALDLPVAGERVARIVAGGEAHAVDVEEVPPVAEKAVVETPAGGIGLGRGRSEPRLEEIAVVALIEQQQYGILVEHQILRAGLGALAQPRAQLFGHALQALHDAPCVDPRPLRVVHLLAPDRLAFHEIAAQRRALELDPLRQEGIRVSELRHRLEKRALPAQNQFHRHLLYDMRQKMHITTSGIAPRALIRRYLRTAPAVPCTRT